MAHVRVNADALTRHRLTTLLETDGHTVDSEDNLEERSGEWVEKVVQVILEIATDADIIGALLLQYLNREKLGKVAEVQLLGPDGKVLRTVRRER